MPQGPGQAEWAALFARSGRARQDSRRQMQRVAGALRELAVTQEAIADSLSSTIASSREDKPRTFRAVALQARELSASLEASATYLLGMASPGTESVSWVALPTDSAPAAARSWIKLELSKWGIESDEHGALLLVADELVTNAARHANTVIKVTLVRCRTTVTVAVRDHVLTTPHRTLDSPDRATFGLDLVDLLAVQGWWCAPHTGPRPGKTIWAQIPLSDDA